MVRMTPEPNRLETGPRVDASVQHLIDLGYADPDAEVAREFAVRRLLEAEFHEAVKQYERGGLDEAARAFEKLVAADPDWVGPRQALAELYYRQGRIGDARAQLEWLTLRAVERPRLALIAGAIALSRREVSEAVELFRYAAHVEPELPSVHSLFGAALLRCGDVEAAERAFHTALKHNDADTQAMEGLAAASLRQSDYTGAANYALAALERDMHCFRAHCHLGVALAYLERPQDAVAAFENAARINARGAAPYWWLRRIAASAGDDSLAAQYRSRGRAVVRQRRTPAGE